MELLPIKHYPDPVLKKVAAPVEEVTDEIRQLAAQMAATMYAAPGVGLAAPQVGVSIRLIVLDCSPKDGEPELIKAINPEIIATQGSCCEEEGCLSVPEYYAQVERAEVVKVRYFDLDLDKMVEREADGLLGVCFQHETDHLDGILFVDHLSSLKKSLFRRKYKKIMAQREVQL